jgi:hypothetical protein
MTTIPVTFTSVVGRNSTVFRTSLENLIIGDNVTSIGSQAFRDCTNLESVTIGNSVTSIDGSAFRDCTSLASVTFKSSAPPSFGSSVFQNTPALTTIYVPLGAKSAYQAVSQLSGYNIL